MNITNFSNCDKLSRSEIEQSIQLYEQTYSENTLSYCSICEHMHENNTWCQFGGDL